MMRTMMTQTRETCPRVRNKQRIPCPLCGACTAHIPRMSPSVGLVCRLHRDLARPPHCWQSVVGSAETLIASDGQVGAPKMGNYPIGRFHYQPDPVLPPTKALPCPSLDQCKPRKIRSTFLVSG